MKSVSTSNFTLPREQALNVAEHTLKVFRTELIKTNLVSFELIAEVSRDVAFINALFDNPTMVQGYKLQCVYEGEEATAELSMLVREENLLARDKHILHFACPRIENTNAQGERYRFLLPHVDFGFPDYSTEVVHPGGGSSSSRDYIRFMIEGKEWFLRRLIEFEDILYTVEDAIVEQRKAGVGSPNLRPSGHAALEVASEGMSQSSALEVAGDICWLLNLAFAQRVAWSEMHVVSGSTTTFACKRAAAFPVKSSGSNPIHNSGDGALQRYLEGSWSVFESNVSWWRVTLNWFSIATENSALESSSMIYCMLFDRISSLQLKDTKFPKQIGEDLAKELDDPDSREKLTKEIGGLLRNYSAKWNDERSLSIVKQVELWNNTPSYPKKIAEAFKLVDLNPPSGKMLNHRHTLMHGGNLKLESYEALEFLKEINQQILLLLLSMLGYRGKFFCLVSRICVKKEALEALQVHDKERV